MGAGDRHGHGHRHGHAHAVGRAADRGRLRLVLLVTGSVMLVELVGAWLSGSLALLADAGHMLSDAAAVTLALSASYVAGLPATSRRSFGYHRAEILAALANAVVLLGVCGYLVYEGVRRLVDPVEVESGTMLVFAAVGLAANLLSLRLLHGRRRESMNMRGAYLEVLGDLLGSAIVVAAALVLLTTGFTRADPIASLVVAALVLPRSFTLLRDAVEVLLETTPANLDLDDVRVHLSGVPGVVDVHDLHAWTLTSGIPVLSAHIAVTDAVLDERGVGRLLDEFSSCVAEHFAVEHATFQVEPAGHRAHENLGPAHT